MTNHLPRSLGVLLPSEAGQALEKEEKGCIARGIGVYSKQNVTGPNSPPLKGGVLPVYREGGGWAFLSIPLSLHEFCGETVSLLSTQDYSFVSAVVMNQKEVI